MNKHFKTTTPEGATHISIKSLGVNEYQHIHNVAYLAATNGIPQIIQKLKDEYELTDNDILDEFILPDAYQTVLRTSLRTEEVQADRTVVVGSKELAVKLAELIEGATVHQLEGFEKQDKRHTAIPMSAKDRKMKSRLESMISNGNKLKPQTLQNLNYLVMTYPQCAHMESQYYQNVSPFQPVS